MGPISVLTTTSTAVSWTVWLPVIAAVVTASVAFVGVVLANRSAGRREQERWRKDETLAMTMDLLALADKMIHRANTKRNPDPDGLNSARLYRYVKAIEILAPGPLQTAVTTLVNETNTLCEVYAKIAEEGESAAKEHRKTTDYNDYLDALDDVVKAAQSELGTSALAAKWKERGLTPTPPGT